MELRSENITKGVTKMEKINWRELLEKEIDFIREALVEAYTDACGEQANSGFLHGVKMDFEGNVYHYLISPDKTPSDVWNHKAIEIARIAEFNPLNDKDENEEILIYLKNEELQAFTQFLKDKRPSLYQLRLWKPEIADRVEKKYIENYVANTAYEWASKILNEAIERFSVSVE